MKQKIFQDILKKEIEDNFIPESQTNKQSVDVEINQFCPASRRQKRVNSEASLRKIVSQQIQTVSPMKICFNTALTVSQTRSSINSYKKWIELQQTNGLNVCKPQI